VLRDTLDRLGDSLFEQNATVQAGLFLDAGSLPRCRLSSSMQAPREKSGQE
jgi:hypothetical protein